MNKISPITTSRTLVGYDVLGYSEDCAREGFTGGHITARVLKHFDDSSSKEDTLTLWSGTIIPERTALVDGEKVVVEAADAREGIKYADAGQWTDEDARKRIEQILAGER